MKNIVAQLVQMVRPVVRGQNLWFRYVLLDPGHGGRDAGAVSTIDGHLIAEAEIALAICLQTELLLTNLTEGRVKVGMTHRGLGLSKQSRIAVIKQASADVLVSVHCNSDGATARGGEIYTTRGETVSDAVAASIAQEVMTHFPGLAWRYGNAGRLDKEAGFYVLNTQESLGKPGVLLETMFISNPGEARLLKQSLTQLQFAVSIVSGLLKAQLT